MTIVKSKRRITTKLYKKKELWFLCSACRLMMLNLTMKFYDNIFNSFQVIEQTRNYHSLISKEITAKMYRQELGFCT